MTPLERFYADLTRNFLIAEGMTDAAGYAEGATVIQGAFTGTFTPGDKIGFVGDGNQYSIDPAFVRATDPTSITLAAPGLLQALPASLVAVEGLALPRRAELARLCPFDDAAMELPMIAVAADQNKGKHPKLPQVSVIVRLRVKSSAGAVDDTTPGYGTPTEDAIYWMDQIRLRLMDTEAFRCQLLALTEEQRRGYELKLRIVAQDVAHSIDAEQRTQTWELTVNQIVELL